MKYTEVISKQNMTIKKKNVTIPDWDHPLFTTSKKNPTLDYFTLRHWPKDTRAGSGACSFSHRCPQRNTRDKVTWGLSHTEAVSQGQRGHPLVCGDPWESMILKIWTVHNSHQPCSGTQWKKDATVCQNSALHSRSAMWPWWLSHKWYSLV